MLHFDQGGDNAGSRTFFDHIVAQHVPFDVIGLSYYPFWHGTLSQLRANVDDLAPRYGKDVVIAETQYAWTLGWRRRHEQLRVAGVPARARLPGDAGGPAVVRQRPASIWPPVPDGHGLGLFYWEPEWIPGVGWEPGAGTPNDNLTLFDFTGARAAVGRASPTRSRRARTSPRERAPARSSRRPAPRTRRR